MPRRPNQFGKSVKAVENGGSASLRDRSATYRRQRLAILSNEPLCRYCRALGHVTPATIIDHVVALSLGGTNGIANLAPACRACNDAKAIIEARCVARGYDVKSAQLDAELSMWIRMAQVT